MLRINKILIKMMIVQLIVHRYTLNAYFKGTICVYAKMKIKISKISLKTNKFNRSEFQLVEKSNSTEKEMKKVLNWWLLIEIRTV